MIHGAKRAVPADCEERVVHAFFRTLPVGAFQKIAQLEEREEPSRCSSTIDYPTDSGGFTTHATVSGYVFREQPILVVKFDGKHYGVPRDYEAFERLGDEVVVYDDPYEPIERSTPVFRMHTAGGEVLECLYNRYDGTLFAPDSYKLKAAFVCGAELEVVKAFVVAAPMQPSLQPGRE